MVRRLIAVVNAFVGPYPGGLAVATTLACLFFAAISRSSPATVAAIGSVMIPALIKGGYDERFSIRLVTSAGSLGIVVPPSIPMILYCMVMNVSVAELFMAGIVPGPLIGGVFIFYAVLLAHRNRWVAEEKPSWRWTFQALRDGLWGLMVPRLVLGGIYSGVFSPIEAAGVSVVHELAVEIFIRREIRMLTFPGSVGTRPSFPVVFCSFSRAR
jgi:C4-dicarboxylate transporter DctM subunit